MPKNKPSKKEESSDSDSGPDDRGPAPKKPKTPSGKSSGEELSFEIGRNRFLKLTEFKGKWYVDVREFYDAGGDLKPGKKGIMLTMEQWQKLKDNIDNIDEAIKKNV